MNLNDKKHNVKTSDSPLLLLQWDVLQKIITTIGCLEAESGGVIGGNGDDSEVSSFHFDESSQNSSATYSPDYKLLNQLFKSDWNPKGIRLRGFVHSHPGHMGHPSSGDEVYAGRILEFIDDLDCLWLPIINTVPNTGMFRLTPWAAYSAERGVSLVRGRIQIVCAPNKSSLTIRDVNVLESIPLGVPLHEIHIRTQQPERSTSYASLTNFCALVKKIKQTSICQHHHDENKATKPFDVGNTFNRVRKAYDIELMRKSRIIAIGAGGAATWLEDTARAGVEEFVIIDPDVVSETNLATQQTYRKDIGRPKVDCIAERIKDINPNARIIVLQESLDEITDDEMRQLAVQSIDGHDTGRTILCGLTDNFFAQARVNRLALHLGVPSLCAQVYREGRGAEITFTYPGVTPACHRCILSSRYRHFIEQDQENDVTSHGTPIFATARLNAIKGFLVLALIHHGSNHPRWGSMLSRIGNRNLVQLRMDPDFAETLGLRVFDRVFDGADTDRLFFDEVVWLPQNQECPDTGYSPCPDCGGTGDLRDSIGIFTDTRLQPKVPPPTTSEGSLANPNGMLAIETYKQNGRAI